MATKQPTPTQTNGSKYTVMQVNIRSVDRSPKDIADYRDAHRSAENVYFPNRTRLYDLYDEIRLDAHLSGVINKRILTVLNKQVQFQANDKKVDELDAFIGSPTFRDLLHEILEAKFWGFSLLEWIPGKKPAFYSVPRKHVKPQKAVVTEDQDSDTGVDYSKMWNMLFVGKPDDLGLLLKCIPYALYKRGNMADWAQYVEIYGQPIRVMKYNPFDVQTKMELKKVTDEAGGSLAVMIPEGVDFDLKDGKQSNGDGKLQNTFKEAMNAEMSVLVLGNTETTTNGETGSQAKSKIHQEQQLEIVRSDMADVLSVLNSEQFIAILRSYGLPVDGGVFTFSREFDFEQIKAQVEIINQVKGGGTPVDDDHIYEVTGIPKPKDYDKIKTEQEKLRAKRAAQIDDADDEEDEPKGKAVAKFFARFFG